MPLAKVASPNGTKPSLFDGLRNLADEIQTAKTAAAKTAAPTPKDPGGYAGGSSHPTADVDNHGQNATEGSRSSENTADVKADIGKPSVDSTPDATAGTGSGDQDSVQLNIGTQQSATGEDPSVEDDYKNKKDDPGTAHPAKAGEGGEKYSSVSFFEGKKMASAIGNSILADLANGFGDRLNTKAAGSQPNAPAPRTSAPNAAVTSPTPTAPAAKQASAPLDSRIAAGYELASLLGVSKEAAFKQASEVAEGIINDARLDADLFGPYLLAIQKRASGDAAEGESHEPPPEGGEGGGGGGDLAAMLSGGGGGGAEPPMPGGGGGGPPAPGGDAGGGGIPGGPPSEDEALAQLAAALEELGIPLDVLAQAGGGGGGAPPGGGMPPMPGGEGGGPGGPPGAGGMPPGLPGGGGAEPPMPGGPGEGAKLASLVLNYKRSGKYQIKAASTPRERALRDYMKKYALELIRS